jgi:hypothetical protein
MPSQNNLSSFDTDLREQIKLRSNTSNSRRGHTFTQDDDVYTYKPDAAINKYYQVCAFKHPSTNKYDVRKFIINEKNEFISITKRKYNDAQYAKFFKEHRQNEYKLYATYNLDMIDYPKAGDIFLSQSSILNSDHTTYDYKLL